MAAVSADKRRRQQKLAIGGAVLLVVVLAIQVPRTLKMVKGTANESAVPAAVASSDPTSPATAPTAAPAVSPNATEPAPKALPRGKGFRHKDPFAARPEGSGAAGAQKPKGDLGFRLVPGAGATADTAPATKNGSFVVVLRSLPVRGGQGTALRAAADFRRRGIDSAGVLVSSRYKSLHRGYYVVHAGRFPNRLAALEGVLAARRAGAENPYVRPLKA
jgi:hypothetical protein